METSVAAVNGFLSALRVEFSGQVLKQILDLRRSAKLKADSSYVTEGDLLAQHTISGMAVQMLPSPVIVSEELEAKDYRNDADALTLVIDPIDGTENFTCGLPLWGMSISCYEKRAHVSSLIACPELDWWLLSGQVPAPAFTSRVRGLSSSLNKEQVAAATSGFEYRIFGCCVFNMISTIRGSLFSFENPKGAWPWDILGGLNLALEAGLSVTVEDKPYAGEYLAPDRRYRFKVEQR